jgi:tetratricopeptide (TPR) repeat protein
MRTLCYLTLLLFPGFLCFGQSATPSPSPGDPATVNDTQQKLQHGQPQQAIEDLQQLAAKQPPVPGASRALGIAYYRTGKLIDAEQAFAKAMAQDSADVESIQMRGLLSTAWDVLPTQFLFSSVSANGHLMRMPMPIMCWGFAI